MFLSNNSLFLPSVEFLIRFSIFLIRLHKVIFVCSTSESSIYSYCSDISLISLWLLLISSITSSISPRYLTTSIIYSRIRFLAFLLKSLLFPKSLIQIFSLMEFRDQNGPQDRYLYLLRFLFPLIFISLMY